MGGEIKALEFSQGTAVLNPPTAVFTSATGTLTFADDAAYVTAKGSAATTGNFYSNSTTGKMRKYGLSGWADLNDTLDNVAAAAPTVNDDSGDSYSIGSKWLNTLTGEWSFANDVTVGAAVWKTFVDLQTNQTITGQKTFSGITSFTNSLDATNKDTAGVVFDGGVGIEKSVFIGLNLTIGGDLTVNGTTTTINTTTLEVEDPNIVLNNGGTKLTADGISGLTVEMSDETHASLIYVSTATSKWKCGSLGTEIEIATISASQILTNKTIDGDNNTISNLAHGSEVDNPTSGAHGVTGSFVGTSDTQTLSNKTLLDGSTYVANTASPTKLAQFDCSSITAGQTRVFTFPDISMTLVGQDNTQSLTNKSLADANTLFFDTDSITRLARFDCAAITAGQTRVISFIDADMTLVGLTNIQSVTNKALADATTTFYDTDSITRLARIDCASITAGNTRVITVPDMDLTLLGTSTSQVVTNKDIDGGTASNTNRITIPQNTLVNLQGLTRKKGTILYDTTNDVMLLDDGAALNELGGGGGGGSALDWNTDDGAPLEVENGVKVYKFFSITADTKQVNKCFVKVPESYKGAKQISLIIYVYSPNAFTAAETYFIKTNTYLVVADSDAMDSTSHLYASTNSAINISATAKAPKKVTLDLTNGSGVIDSISVAAGDLLRIEMERGTDTDTAETRVLVAMELTFN